MPIVRTYGCGDCSYVWEVTLSADQWDAPTPDCPMCAGQVHQEFAPPRINGSPSARAHAIADDIIHRDYGADNFQRDARDGSIPQVQYRDDMMGVPKRQGRTWKQPGASTWGATGAALGEAAASGRVIRQRYGNGLDVLESCLKDGSQPDLIANSKRISSRVW